MSVLIDFTVIREAISMEAVLSAYGIAVRRKAAICPFHADKHPSMKVYAHSFYCFACAAGGDVINFVARMDGVSNVEAAKRVAAMGGLKLAEADYRTLKSAQKRAQERRKTLLEREADEKKYIALCEDLHRTQYIVDVAVPLSDMWCLSKQRETELGGELDELFERLCT